MTQDEIIEMARQANAKFAELPMMDAIVFSVDDRNWNSKELEAFTKLVEERTAAKEREACADLCDSEKKWWDGMSHSEKDIYQAIDNISALIRARGEAT